MADIKKGLTAKSVTIKTSLDMKKVESRSKALKSLSTSSGQLTCNYF